MQSQQTKKFKIDLGGPLIISVIFHGLVFVLVGSTIIFEKQIINSGFIMDELVPSSSDQLVDEEQILLEDTEEVVLDLPTEDLEMEEVDVTAPNVSALAETITSTATIDTGFDIAVPEGAMFEVGAATTNIGRTSSSPSATTGQGVVSRVSFFGLEAEGGDIQFIIDLSGSMTSDGRLKLLKKQLEDSIAKLEDGTRVNIVCFARTSWNWGDSKKEAKKENWKPSPPRWITITPSTKQKLLSEVKALSKESTFGGTNWLAAVTQAQRITPKPAAVFFMTDGKTDETRQLGDFKKLVKTWSKREFAFNGVFLGDSSNAQCESALESVCSYTKGTFKVEK